MNATNVITSTNVVPIIEPSGKALDTVTLPQKVRPVPRRRCCVSDNDIYYKGAGIVYTGHFVNECNQSLKLLSETEMLYEKYHVVYPHLFRRYGIFTFQHQPVFSDYEGACGPKERNLLELQKKCDFSAIQEIVDVISTPVKEHAIYAYRLKEEKGDYRDTLKLIEYILCEDFNTAWDKNLWDDIANFGYIRDLADWFVSKDFCHKLGTIYAFLTSLLKKDKYTYEMVVRKLTCMEQLSDVHIIYISAQIVKKFCPDSVTGIELEAINNQTYSALWHALYSGKACCHLEKEEDWLFVRDIYKKGIQKNIDIAMQDYSYYLLMQKRIGKSF